MPQKGFIDILDWGPTSLQHIKVGHIATAKTTENADAHKRKHVGGNDRKRTTTPKNKHN